jgi:2,3-dihydroxybenzoate decarboxylase
MTLTPKIALEEHFMHPDFIEYFGTTAINISPDLFGKAREALLDFGERRLAAMDVIGVEKSILSLAGPGVQAEPQSDTAVRGNGQAPGSVWRFCASRDARPARGGK